MSRVWTQQPQYPVGIDSRYGEKLGVLFHAPTRSDYRSNAKKLTLSGRTNLANAAGLGVGFSGGLGAIRFDDNSDIEYANKFSVLWVAATAAANYRVILGSRVPITGFLRAFILASSTGAISVEGTPVDSSTSIYRATTAGGVIDGKVHVFALVKSAAGEHQFYRDGVRISTTTTASGDPQNASGSVFEIGGINTGISSYDHQEPINLFALWNGRALSDSEAISLTSNPWQIFQPLPSRIFVGPAAATGNVTLDPYVGSVIVTGYVPTFGGSQTIAGVKGSVTLTGYVATLEQDVNLSGVKGSVTLTGYLPTVAQPQVITGIKGSVTATGYTPILDQDQAITAVKGSVTATGYVPTLEQDVALSPTKGSVSVTGFIPDWTQTASGTLIPSRGSITLTGYVPTLEQDITLSGIKGSVVASGYAPAVVQEYVVNPLTGAVVLTGKQPSIAQGADTVITPATANAILSGYIPTITQVAPTIARPSSDLTGTWSASDGGANKYAMIDETVMDNADYIYTNTLGATQRMPLSAVADPGTTAGQVFSYAVWSPSGNGITVRLLNSDDSLIAEWIHAGPLSTTPPTTPIDQSLTPTQIAAIQSYSGIVLEVEAIT